MGGCCLEAGLCASVGGHCQAIDGRRKSTNENVWSRREAAKKIFQKISGDSVEWSIYSIKDDTNFPVITY